MDIPESPHWKTDRFHAFVGKLAGAIRRAAETMPGHADDAARMRAA